MKTLKGSKFSIIFFLTYLIYPMILIFDWIYLLGDYTCVGLVILLVLYEIIYIFFLAKKENVSLGRAIARGFLYLLFMPNIYCVWYYTYIFINGYHETAFMGPITASYYGFEAWKHDVFAAICYIPVLVTFIIYSICYFTISNHLKKKKSADN